MTTHRSEPRLFFLFGDATLGYHCASCDTHCCDGTVAVHRVKEAHFFERYPHLVPFCRPTPSDTHIAFEVPSQRCPLVQESGCCHAHEAWGFDAKPAACQLFPTNQNLYVASHNLILVGVNLYCSITLAEPERDDAVVIRHDEIAALLRHQFGAQLATPKRAAAHLAHYPLDFTELEVAIQRQGASYAGDFLDALAWQQVATDHACFGVPMPARFSDEQLREARRELEQHLERVHQLYGASPDVTLSEPLLRRLLAIMGLVRMDVFLAMSTASYEEVALNLPRVLATLYGLLQHRLALTQATGQSSCAQLSIPRLNSFFMKMRRVAWLLAHLDDHVRLPEGGPSLDGLPEYVREPLQRLFDDLATRWGAERPLEAHLTRLRERAPLFTPVLHALAARGLRFTPEPAWQPLDDARVERVASF